MSDDEKQEEEQKVNTLREELEAAFDAADFEEGPKEEPEKVTDEAAPKEEEIIGGPQEEAVPKPEAEQAAEEESSEGDEAAAIDCTPFCRTDEERATFEGLSREAQEIVSTRYSDFESDYKSKLETNAQDRTFAEEVRAAVSPYEAMLRAEGSDALGAVSAMLNTAYQLRNGTPEQKRQQFDQLARTYGVDIDQLGADDEYVDPQMKSLQDQIAAQNQTISQFTTQQQTVQQDTVTQQVVEFTEATDDKGNLKHPHFETIKPEILSLLDTGNAANLEDAYEKALWINTETSAQMRTQLQDSARADVTKEKESKLAAAKKAEGVKPGSSVSEPGAVRTEKLSLHDELLANWDAMEASG